MELINELGAHTGHFLGARDLRALPTSSTVSTNKINQRLCQQKICYFDLRAQTRCEEARLARPYAHLMLLN